MKKLNFEKIKRDPKENNGWSFDYRFLEKIQNKSDEYDFFGGMEEIDSMLLAIYKMDDF